MTTVEDDVYIKASKKKKLILSRSIYIGVNYFASWTQFSAGTQKRDKSEIVKDWEKKVIGVLWRWLQRNPTRSFGSHSRASVLCSSARATAKLGGQITLASLREAAYLARGIVFLYSTESRIPSGPSSFLHVRNGHHVPRCLRRNKKKRNAHPWQFTMHVSHVR